MKTSLTARLIAAAAAVATTFVMLSAVVSLGDPGADAHSQQLAALAPAAR